MFKFEIVVVVVDFVVVVIAATVVVVVVVVIMTGLLCKCLKDRKNFSCFCKCS